MPFARPKKKPDPLDENALYDYAVVALGRRMRTVAELKRLMQARLSPAKWRATRIDAVIARLKEYGYLNDADFAAYYTRSCARRMQAWGSAECVRI